MNINYILALIIGFLLIGIGGMYYNYDSQPLVSETLEANPAAIEIANLYHVKVFVEDLGTDGNGYTVCGQTRFINGEVYEVVLDDSIDPNSYQAIAILYHEEGHIYLAANGLVNDEAGADDFAASKGYNITDAYHGVH